MKGLGSVVLCILTGCAQVPPHARADLASPQMQPTADDLEATLESHVHENREGSAGATPVRGASCGCN